MTRGDAFPTETVAEMVLSFAARLIDQGVPLARVAACFSGVALSIAVAAGVPEAAVISDLTENFRALVRLKARRSQ